MASVMPFRTGRPSTTDVYIHDLLWMRLSLPRLYDVHEQWSVFAEQRAINTTRGKVDLDIHSCVCSFKPKVGVKKGLDLNPVEMKAKRNLW